MNKSLILLPLMLLLTMATPPAQAQSDSETTDGYFDESPDVMPGALPGSFESRCDGYFRKYHLNSVCEFVVDQDHHNQRMATFTGTKTEAEKKAYEMAYGRMKQSAKVADGISGAAKGDLDIFMNKAQVSKAIATMCKNAYKSCSTDWCKGPEDKPKCAVLSAGQAQFDKDAQQNLQSAFKSVKTIQQATGK
jgi:hypothetical protein